MTKNGKIILDIINESACHPTAEEVYRISCDRGNKMSVATVYNNLARLSEDGLIRRLSSSRHPDRFDKIIRHDHLVCSKCGKIEDVYMKDLTELFEAETGLDIAAYNLTLNYLCDECK